MLTDKKSTGKIPLFRPYLDKDIVDGVRECLDRGWLGMGRYTRDFEMRIAEFIGVPPEYIVATHTGTSALHLALLAADIGPGQEVITPSFNFLADPQAILATGAEVVFCDIRERDLGIDCEKAESLINSRTRAILPLHYAGIPCDREEVYQLSKKHGLRVIEDASHAFGTEVGGKKIGNGGDFVCFSFGPVKIVTSIDGGCVIAPDNSAAERLRRLRILGCKKNEQGSSSEHRIGVDDVIELGFRYHLNNVLASIGLVQLKRIEEFLKTRRETCRRYQMAFQAQSGIILPKNDFQNISPFLYFLRVEGGKRNPLKKFLDTKGIEAGCHFPPAHAFSQFRRCRRGDLEVTDKICREILTLPLYSHMEIEIQNRVIEAVLKFFNAESHEC